LHANSLDNLTAGLSRTPLAEGIARA
jgi:hypothetical protein